VGSELRERGIITQSRKARRVNGVFGGFPWARRLGVKEDQGLGKLTRRREDAKKEGRAKGWFCVFFRFLRQARGARVEPVPRGSGVATSSSPC
jgi:hypothetical protein